ncbi:MAG: hypothetical protein KF850_24060 [Labilithrix sp.]|nr:hypothetical protein [Labilithrix sp.]MBX3215132.1 hypothetical protein [Labilithrix sp.]
MPKPLRSVALFSVFLVGAAACAGAEPDGATPAGSSAPNGAGEGEPGEGVGGAAKAMDVHRALESACDEQFTAMRARHDRCPDLLPLDSVPALKLAADDGDREAFVASCVARGRRSGSGYDAAFLKSCAQAMKTAPCGDDTDVVAACWEPKGELARGARCASDDQCSDGYCRLPDGARAGSSCGECDTPVWDGYPCSEQGNKCGTGEVCWGGHMAASCVPLRVLLRRSSCSYDYSEVYECGPARFCAPDGSCAPRTVVKIGEACDFDRGLMCGEGAVCDADGTCKPSSYAKLGESCDDRPCRDWLTCDATTGTCKPIEGLECK